MGLMDEAIKETVKDTKDFKKTNLKKLAARNKQVGGNHYQSMKIQPAEFINKNKLPFAEGNAIKYICRHINKGGEQDLEKAKHYIDMIIERDYGDDAEKSKVMSGLPKGYSFADNSLSISSDEGLPQDKTEDELEGISITYGGPDDSQSK